MVNGGSAARGVRALTRAYACPVERTLAVVGAKWTLSIIRDLVEGPRRFSELERSLHGASPKVISARLRELERLGMVSRTVYPEVPPRVVYALTSQGRSFRPIIEALRTWGRALENAS
ncbi:MAG: helix-turn-helix transcriptional regulator [Chloroflexi bacterium]|nr:helix-turn-helix transcriptional regulator [Chloroflexota bacterium]